MKDFAIASLAAVAVVTLAVWTIKCVIELF